MSGQPAGALLGLTFAVGLLLALRRLPMARRPTLDDRLAPYLRDRARPSKLLSRPQALTPFPTLERLAAPLLTDGMQLLDRVVGGTASARRRLEQAGRGLSLEELRAQQVLLGLGGLLAGLGLCLMLSAGDGLKPLPLLFLPAAGAISAVVARDRALSMQVARRETRMMSEFPTVAELLALAVTAGEGAVGALERVAKMTRGELSTELGRALADARAGSSLVTALEGMSSRTSLHALGRFVDGVAVAVERGTPLADVLRAQAVDAREAGRRALLESGGRKEIAMMVPVVFLVLPVTVLFALFPGFYGLSLAS